MPNLPHLIHAIRSHLPEEDLELLDLACESHNHPTYEAEDYDRAFDRVLSRVRREYGPQLQRRCGLPS